jgi:hypothetical protein
MRRDAGRGGGIVYTVVLYCTVLYCTVTILYPTRQDRVGLSQVVPYIILTNSLTI